MNLNFQDLIPGDFNENSHVWVYQSNRAFTIQESFQIKEILEDFTKSWKSNGIPVKGYANLFFEHFIIFIADESATGVGAFSTDGSVKLVQSIENAFQVELFDRLMHAFVIGKRIQLLPLTQVNPSIEKELLTPKTLYFNNTILTRKELMDSWIIPLKDSWLSIRVLENDTAEVEF